MVLESQTKKSRKLQLKNSKKNISSQERKASYDRFFINAYTKVQVSEIKKEGAKNLQEFLKATRGKIHKDYYSVLEKNMNLTSVIFSKYFKDDKVEIVEFRTRGKSRRRFQVSKGQSFVFGGKVRKGGQFLPRSYFEND